MGTIAAQPTYQEYQERSPSGESRDNRFAGFSLDNKHADGASNGADAISNAFASATKATSTNTYVTSTANQSFPPAARSDQPIESHGNTISTQLPVTFGGPIIETRNPSATEPQPVNHEDEIKRYPFAAIPGARDSQHQSTALINGISMQQFGVR